MKILHSVLSKEYAGSERYTHVLATQSATRHEVVVVLSRRLAKHFPHASSRDFSKKAPFRIRVISNRRPWSWLQLWFIIRREKPDIIHSHLGTAGRLLRRYKNAIPLVASLHVGYRVKAHAHMHGLIAVNKEEVTAAPPSHLGKAAYFPIPVDLKAPSPPHAVEDLRLSLGIKKDAVVIGTVGRLNKVKGFDRLIMAFAALNPVKSAHAVLVIVGDGMEEKSLKRQAEPLGGRVIFAGFQKNPQIYYSLFDVFVSSSRVEMGGTVFLEAMAARCPIIATDTQAARLWRDDGDPITVVENGNVKALSKEIAKYAISKPKRIKYDLRHKDATTVARRIEEFYTRVIEHKATLRR